MNDKCKLCAYRYGISCRVMTEMFDNCWAFADNNEKIKREKAIKIYNNSISQ